MRRAVRDTDKEARRQALRDVAWRLFGERPYEAINVQDVAAEAGLAKGTLYLYFATKEELYLSVQEQQFAAWFDRLDARLLAMEPGSPAEAFAAAISACVVAAPDFVRLLTITHAVLERNAGAEAILRLKRLLRDRLLAAGAALERGLPGLPGGHGARALLHAYALIVGLYGLAAPTRAADEALRDNPDLALFRVDFATELTAALTALLHGMGAGAPPRG